MGPQVNRKAANGDQDHNSEVTKVTVAFWAKRLKTKGFHRKEENVSMGQAQVAATVALSQKPNLAFPCRIFRPAATPTRWTQLTLVSTTSRLFQDRKVVSPGLLSTPTI
jgi:hypothetical protein